MFYYLNGKITILDNNLAVVDCAGVGYACHCSTYTQSQLRVGEERRLYTHVNVKEDAFDIYGFSGREEQRLFELLTGVTKDVFRRSAFIEQGNVGVKGSPELEKRIAAIVSTGEEQTS